MKKRIQAQLSDGRWVELKELTVAETARAYEAAAPRGPNGALTQPNPVMLDHENLKLSLTRITDPLPLYRLDDNGQRLKKLGADNAPMLRDGKPVYERSRAEDVPENAWRTVSYTELELHFDEWFGVRERNLLLTLFARLNHVLEDVDRDFFDTIHTVVASG